MKIISVSILAIVMLAGGYILSQSNANTSDTETPSQPITNNAVERITPATFVQLAQEETAFILDVHTPKQTHIPGTDTFIPYDQISQHTDQLPTDKDTPILVYCRSGNMSAQAAKEIAALGYTTVYDLEGGTNAYKEQQVSVQLTPIRQELGTVIYGDVANTTFTLTNYTPLPTKITRVSTSCGCTSAEVENKELKAYESTTVTVSFDPAVHKDDTDLGDITRTIYIETDNPNYPELESTITANVIRNE